MRTRLTVRVRSNRFRAKAKRAAARRGVSLSRLVENYLRTL